MAENLQQGEEYVEEQSTDNEASEKKEMNLVRTALIAVAGVVLVVIFAGGFFLQSARKATKNDKPVSGLVVPDADASQEEWDAYYESMEEATNDDDEIDFFGSGQTFDDNTSDVTPSEGSLIYSDAEVEKLRSWGYTGDEIELHSSMGTSVDSLVDYSKLLQEDALLEIYNKGTKEYKRLLKNTWLGQKNMKLPSDCSTYFLETYNYNLDYHKVSPKGSQLILRLDLEEGGNAFMFIPPDRWQQLKDDGNIVVSITYAVINDFKVITEIKEVMQ